MMILTTNSEKETQAIAHWMAQNLAPQAIALVGTLGMGKTCFAKGFLEALGIDPDSVSSPTFAIVHEYDTEPTVLHLDLYRLEPDDLPNLALDERIDEQVEDDGGFVLVEWANKHPELLPTNTLWLSFSLTEQGRQITVDGPHSVLAQIQTWSHQQ